MEKVTKENIDSIYEPQVAWTIEEEHDTGISKFMAGVMFVTAVELMLVSFLLAALVIRSLV